MTAPQAAKRVSREQRIPLSDVIVGERARKDYGDVTGLAESMRELGLIQPVVLAPGHHLLAGGRRLEAAKSLGWQTIPFVSVDIRDDAVTRLKAERDENTCRKEMTPGELLEIGRRLEELETPAAKTRMQEGGRRGAELTNSGVSQIGATPVAPKPRTRTATLVADGLGISETQYTGLKRIDKAAKDDRNPELQNRAKCSLEKLDAGKTTISGEYNELFLKRRDSEIAPGITGNDLDALNVPKRKPEPEYIGRADTKKQVRALDATVAQLSGIASALEATFPGGFEQSLTTEIAQANHQAIKKSLRRITAINNTLTGVNS